MRRTLSSKKESFGFRCVGVCESEESDEREYDTIKERGRECSEGKDFTKC